jgi:hypothetical protein
MTLKRLALICLLVGLLALTNALMQREFRCRQSPGDEDES